MTFNFFISDQLFLDVLFMKIRSKTIYYATMDKTLDRIYEKGKRKEKDLENSIQSLKAKTVLTENEKKKLEQDQQELVAIRDKRMEVLLCSRARWTAECDKITKYCYGLKKRNSISKQMTKRTSNNGEEICESKDIIKEVKLLSERQREDCKILDMVQDIPMLTLQEKTSLEGEITLAQASFALKNLFFLLLQKPWLRRFYC